MSENEIIRGCLKQDAACQKQLYNHYAPKMLGVCYRYARNNGDAEDILQDAFIKIFEKIHQFKFEGAFEGWVRRIVVNTALKKYALVRYSKETVGIEGKPEYDHYDDPAAYSHLTQKDILVLINELPDGYRLIFNLYVIEGYAHEEIAEMLNIKAGTSRSQLVKARNLLQQRLTQNKKIAV